MRFFVKIFAILLFLGGMGLTGYEVYNVVFLEGVNMTLHIPLLVVGAVVALCSLLFLIFKFKGDKRRCKCGHSLQGCAYKWQLVRLYDTMEHQMAQYEVRATCPKCGREKIYNKDFIVASARSGGVANPQKLIEDWCRQMFGH